MNYTRFKQLKLVRYKNMSIIFVSIVLVTSFLFSTGFIEHVTGVYPQSWALDKDQKRTSNDMGIRFSFYTEMPIEHDVVSTIWLSKHLDDNAIVYNGDPDGIWYSYGLLSARALNGLGSIYAFSGTQSGSYAYLSYANTVGGLLNSTEMSPALTSSNKIYTDGASEIFSAAG